MPSPLQSPPLLTPLSREDFQELELFLPTLKVISYTGPGQSGGVSKSLEPVVKRLGTKVHWFAIEGQSLPTQETPPEGFSFYSPKVPALLAERHRKAANEYLWPLLHGLTDRAKFDPENWKAFRQVNEIVASDSLSVSSESFPTLCWLHDYQVPLAAPLMSMQAGLIICQFWHVPWPEPEAIINSPVGKELVDALLCNKLIGFHTTEYATNFLNTVKELFPNAQVDVLKMEVRRRRSHTRVVVMPLGLDFSLWQKLARSNKPKAEAMAVKHRLANQVLLGVDRIDYTKGVLEKLHGLERFLETHESWHRRFHYVQICHSVKAQASPQSEYECQVQANIDRINKRFASNGWQPIMAVNEYLDQNELSAWYQAADVLLVNSIKDGLNLIAKEYVACRQDEQGALILSKQTGSSAELAQGALIVEPECPDSIANAIAQSLSMEVEEKRRRMNSMRRVVGWNQLHDWALGFLRQSIQGRHSGHPGISLDYTGALK
ncbi:MAG TPA: trehalose-6-phosphate synthase [Candidatus Melainabacteria bacterium]|nr:trehalose-6-phosphate synthase [Candidatus Melainabacteria bacterium]